MLEKLIEVYDKLNGAEDLIPLYHSTIATYFKIVLNSNATLNSITPLKNKKNQIVPSTIKSEQRSKSLEAYPIVDNLNYSVSAGKGYKNLTDNLTRFNNSEFSTDNFSVYYKYICNDTLLNDLIYYGIIKSKDLSKMINFDGKMLLVKTLAFEYYVKSENGEETPLISEELKSNYIKYYMKYINEGEKDICYLTGKETICVNNFPNKIMPFNPLARLFISDENIKIGIAESYKMHNALRWLIAKKSINFENLTFIYWSDVVNNDIPMAFNGLDLYMKKANIIDEKEMSIDGATNKYLKDNRNAEIHMLILDCVSTGKISIAGYDVISSDQYFNNLSDWYKFNKRHNTKCSIYDILNMKNINKIWLQSFNYSILHKKSFSPSIVNAINIKWKNKKIDESKTYVFNTFNVFKNNTFESLLVEKGFNCNSLSLYCGVNTMTINDLKNNKTKFGNAKIDTALNIASAFDMTIEEIYEYLRQ